MVKRIPWPEAVAAVARHKGLSRPMSDDRIREILKDNCIVAAEADMCAIVVAIKEILVEATAPNSHSSGTQA